MRTFLCAIVLACVVGLVTNAHAVQTDADLPGSTLQSPNLQVKLLDEPCSPRVLKHLKADFHPRYRLAAVVYEGKPYVACWLPLEGGVVYIVDETGDSGALDNRAFVRPSTI